MNERRKEARAAPPPPHSASDTLVLIPVVTKYLRAAKEVDFAVCGEDRRQKEPEGFATIFGMNIVCRRLVFATEMLLSSDSAVLSSA